MTANPEQLMLEVPIRPPREVGWINVTQVEKKRFGGLFGKKLVRELIYEEGDILASRTMIDVEKISELQDADLRYALRLQDAVNAVGWVSVGACMSYRDDVRIDATKEGEQSRLINAMYSGKILNGHDTFMDTIYGADPSSHADH
jgi:hypothetical protein